MKVNKISFFKLLVNYKFIFKFKIIINPIIDKKDYFQFLNDFNNFY